MSPSNNSATLGVAPIGRTAGPVGRHPPAHHPRHPCDRLSAQPDQLMESPVKRKFALCEVL
ncbi:hypothetical protein CBOM_03741 [Ceraceosorus bombacis]|uniref:Uncharacterized protein n=1 Tax=Ceraceosorus bombacis TaxID=401625 RepID=A0A0P1BHY8_9BASI|nr:hypothetical protein CBOM_03741 [Ceraceosorus bombacis]